MNHATPDEVVDIMVLLKCRKENERLRRLLQAVEQGDRGGICFDVDGESWFNARDAALSATDESGP